jgi:hypothetical protein
MYQETKDMARIDGEYQYYHLLRKQRKFAASSEKG